MINTSTFVVLQPVPLTVELPSLLVVWLWSHSAAPQLVQKYSTSVSQGFYQKEGGIQCVVLMECGALTFRACAQVKTNCACVSCRIPYCLGKYPQQQSFVHMHLSVASFTAITAIGLALTKHRQSNDAGHFGTPWQVSLHPGWALAQG